MPTFFAAKSHRGIWYWLGLIVLLGSSSSSQSQTITVFAASSLTESFTEIGRTFTQQTGVMVRYQFAGSQILRTQLENGASADLFASAENINLKIPSFSQSIFARNRLVVITPKRGAAKVKTLADLAANNTKIVIAQANAPIGKYTRQVLEKLSVRFGKEYAVRVLKNVVSEESNVRQVALKIRLGEADAGIVYLTDVTPDLSSSVIQIAIPQKENIIATYPLWVLRDSSDARAFNDFVLSTTGQGILQRWGFLKKP